MKRKIWLLLLAMTLALLCPLCAGAEAGKVTCSSGSYEYVLLEDGTAQITGYTGTELDVTIPAELDGHPVTAIGEKAFLDIPLTSVVIPDSVTSVGMRAFEASYNDAAAMRCSTLEHIHLGSGIENLYGFSNSINALNMALYPRLASITVSPDHPVFCVENGLLIDKTTATVVCCPAAMTGPVIVPDWVTAIGGQAFSSCAVSSIYLPDSVTSVGYQAFANTPARIRLPDDIPVDFRESGATTLNLIVPRAITQERYELFTVSMKKSTQKKLSTNYTLYRPDRLETEQNRDEIIAMYPAVLEKPLYILKPATSANNMKKIEGYFAEAGYTAADLAADTLETTGKPLPEITWYEKELSLSFSLTWYTPDVMVIAEGAAVENLPGGLAIAWAVEHKLIPADLVRSGDFVYTLQPNGTACIAAYIGEASTVIVPAKLDGHDVTAIGAEAFIFGENVTSVSLPDSVTQLAEKAFLCAEKLTGVHVTPDHPTLASIDGVLFEKATRTLLCYPEGRKNESYKIPEGIRRIAPYAFSSRGDLNVNKVSYETSEGLGQLMIPDSVTEIAPYAFYGNSSVYSVAIGEGVTAIGDFAFYGCRKLIWAEIPGNVRTIGVYAFANCTGLQLATFGEGVTAIGDFAFSSCGSLGSVKIPDSATELGAFAFYGCTSLTEVTIPDSVTELGDCAFYYCSALTDVKLGAGVTRIGKGAFMGCKALTAITVPDNVTELGDEVFSKCEALTSVTIGKGMTELPQNAFNGCEALNCVTLPEGLTRIGADAFSGCCGLTEIALPASVREIDAQAFFHCCELTEMTLPEGLTHIGDSAFMSCWKLERVTIPASVTEIAPDIFAVCDSLSVVNVQRDSYAARYCREKGLPYTYPDALDWLFD